MDETERLHRLQEVVWDYYRAHGRHDLPWRQPLSDGTFDPYRILVSEIMLQQTQVPRVIPKYDSFLEAFPNVTTLANASLGEVLRAWQGLGYNRRAKYLWQTAQQIDAGYDGMFPADLNLLVALPGVGTNTAGAVLAYAFDKPAVFIETNIRTVYIYHFFADIAGVHDSDIHALAAASLANNKSPREFYWALMDYGAHLKRTIGNLNKLSKSYSKQSTFHGSRRQIRGTILRMLSNEIKTYDELRDAIPDERFDGVLEELQSEGLIVHADGQYSL